MIVSADLYVLKYAEEHPEQFTPAVIDSLRQHLSNEPGRPNARDTTNIQVHRKPGDFIRLYAEVRSKLKGMRITNFSEIHRMFLRYDKDRNGFIARENIPDIFRQINLPLENDLIDAVSDATARSPIGALGCLDDCGMHDRRSRKNQSLRFPTILRGLNE